MVTPDIVRDHFSRGLAYDAYVASGTPDQQQSWRAFGARVALLPAQRDLVASFTRKIHVLITSGTWCGDCVQQVPMLAAIAGANPLMIHLRLVDRDKHADLANLVRICGGLRVPTVIFCNEDFEFLSLAGDKSIARMRAIAARALGASCPLPGAPLAADELAATTQDWVTEFERAHLVARLSAKLRERHGD